MTEKKVFVVNCGSQTRFYTGIMNGASNDFYIVEDEKKNIIKINIRHLAVIEPENIKKGGSDV